MYPVCYCIPLAGLSHCGKPEPSGCQCGEPSRLKCVLRPGPVHLDKCEVAESIYCSFPRPQHPYRRAALQRRAPSQAAASSFKLAARSRARGSRAPQGPDHQHNRDKLFGCGASKMGRAGHRGQTPSGNAGPQRAV